MWLIVVSSFQPPVNFMSFSCAEDMQKCVFAMSNPAAILVKRM